MTTPAWAYLSEQDRAAFRATIAFLNKRLAEAATIDWALRLNPAQRVEHLALENLLDGLGGLHLDEPWATAWRLIEESRSAPAIEEGPSTSIYGIRNRIRAGDRSGAVLSNIVALVAPRLKVEPVDSWRWEVLKKPRRPKTFDHLLSAKLSSGGLADLAVLGLADLTDTAFLAALGSALESAVSHGLDIARRLGWDGKLDLWQLGDLGRVYYATAAQAEGRTRDPDAYHHGIAPSVKLLFAVVARIAELNAEDASSFVQRWRLAQSPVHTRLWAAAARSPALVTLEQVRDFLSDLDDRQFWDLHVFPEIAELRARRFVHLDPRTQKAILKRVRKGPPRNHWPRGAEAAKIKEAQLYWAVREMKRIEVAGGVLPTAERTWMDASLRRFSDLEEMSIDEGFPAESEAYAVPPNPDAKYDSLNGIARLRALETALSTSRRSWSDDPAKRANDWLHQSDKALLVLHDLETTGSGGDEFPGVWNRFGRAHSPRAHDAPGAPPRDLQAETDRVLALLNQLSEATLSASIEGISTWLGAWNRQVVASALALPVWLRIWPIAVQATNSESEKADESDLSVTVRTSDDDSEPMDLETLNTPAGRLISVLLVACPSLAEVPNPFDADSNVRHLRDAAISAAGRSGLIVRHRLIEELPYFLRADRDWTEEHLIAPLLKDDGESLALWRAIARRTHFTKVLEIIGDATAERATDRRLGRESRRRLAFSLVIESLHAFRENRNPAVPNPRVQQMLRTLDDEVRASAANAIQQFVRDISANKTGAAESPSAADVFRLAAAPFLEQVWPQERSLATPGVSGAFADLPATSGEAFAEAVDAIERFLVPFECWSMLDYGLHGEDDGETKLKMINTEAKASALLHLLDLTIGSSEGAVVPHDLTEALDQIRSVAPELAKSPVYRRLSTAARR